ncbi:hypothetical protein KFL_014130010, partial [Klebsormidium nitens]
REFQGRCQAHVLSVRGIEGTQLVACGPKQRPRRCMRAKGVVKDSSKTYNMLGFAGHENPAKAKPVKSFRDGYERYLHDKGVKVQRAKVSTESKLDALLGFLAERVRGETDALELCTLLMDQAAVLYLWESLARGKECVSLSANQIEGGESPAAFPGWSKTVRQEPSARIPLAQAGSSQRLTLLR